MSITDLRLAQDRQRAWSERNFPDRNPDHALLGLIEETGELCEAAEPADGTPLEYLLVLRMQRFLGRLAHIQLKRHQGIRKASTTPERERAAIDQLARAFWEYYVTTSGHVPNPNVEPEPEAYDYRKEVDAIGDILIYLIDRCNRKDQDLSNILSWTLADVLKRDWVAAPVTGVAEA
jgi:hypothetical protein